MLTGAAIAFKLIEQSDESILGERLTEEGKRAGPDGLLTSPLAWRGGDKDDWLPMAGFAETWAAHLSQIVLGRPIAWSSCRGPRRGHAGSRLSE